MSYIDGRAIICDPDNSNIMADIAVISFYVIGDASATIYVIVRAS